MTGKVILRSSFYGKPEEGTFDSLDDALVSAYWAIYDNTSNPCEILDAETREFIMGCDEIWDRTAGMWDSVAIRGPQ